MKIRFSQFLKTIVIFRPVKDKVGGSLPGGMDDPSPNSRMRKLAFAFRMYDLNGDGSISKDEILAVLLMMVGDEVPDEQLHCIAERAILEVKCNVINFGGSVSTFYHANFLFTLSSKFESLKVQICSQSNKFTKIKRSIPED